MAEKWKGLETNWGDPATEADSITPADADFTEPPFYRALWVSSDGNVVIRAVDSNTNVTLAGAKAGSIIPVAVKRVAIGTTATVVGLR